MKNKTLHLSLYLLNVAAIAVYYLTQMSERILIQGGILLALLGIALLLRKEKSFRENIPLFLYFWLLQVVSLTTYWAGFAVDVDDIANRLQHYIRYVVDPIFLFALAALVLSKLFLKKINAPVVVAFNYGAAFLVVEALTDMTAYVLGYYSNRASIDLIVAILLVASFGRELRGSLQGKKMPSLLLFGERSLFVLIALVLLGDNLIYTLDEIMRASWLPVGVAALIGVLLLLVEATEEEWNTAAGVNESDAIGVTVLMWCLLAVLMGLLPRFFNEAVLLLGPLVATATYDYITQFCYKENLRLNIFDKVVSGRAFLIYFEITALLALLAAGRIAGMNPLYFVLVLALLVVRYLCLLWTKKGGRQKVMACFWGIFWLLLMVGTQLDFTQLQAEIGRLLAMTPIAVMWCVFCTMGGQISHSSSQIYREEYTTVMKLQTNIPRGMAIVALGLLLLG